MAERERGGAVEMAERDRGKAAHEADLKLEFTPTWIVASVCAVIIFISLMAERYLHHLGKVLKKKNQKPLFNALQKVKEELMLLGFISLLLTVTEDGIQHICIPRRWTHYMLPCKKAHHRHGGHHHRRRMLEEEEEGSYCWREGEVPLLSIEAIHQLHIFIFILAVIHVIFSAITVLIGGAKIHQWKHWEDSIQEEVSRDGIVEFTKSSHSKYNWNNDLRPITQPLKELKFCHILHSFFKQFHSSVSKSDYTTLRLIFIKSHCKGNPKFDFHKYMIRAFESDFEKVVGTSWYLWVYVIIFFLLNVNGWHTYFWIALIPLVLLLAVGTKLEHVISKLAHNVAEKYFAVGGDLVVEPSDEYFWFHRPRILLYMIHFVLFQNAFDIAFLFWLFIPNSFDSCVYNHFTYAVPRIVIGAIIQPLCCYSTLPLYALVTQMGTHFKDTIFEKNVRDSLVAWTQQAKKRSMRVSSQSRGSTNERNESLKETETSRLFMPT
ncbi:MLO-like protein 1 isoform X1 [Canna indica]|uniref:MLO-like protein n=1 Tax=Canna indica TaxID=4628 RepID=A0AAQ3L489_9LILI|nr:MLO-like protein 1 isoform X1 [Canna indica]